MTDAARHWIDGKWMVEGPQRSTVSVYSGESNGAYFDGDAQTAERAILTARRAFERNSWGHQPRRRAAVLNELADAIAARADEIAHAIAIENGKIIAHCRHETAAAISEARYYAGLARAIFGRVTEVDEGKQSILAVEPIGVASIIVPWNAPSTLLLRSLGPALAAGCTVVVKGAHQVSSVNRIFAECLASCVSLPPGVVNVVHGDLAVAQTLCTHPEVDVVSFTGSSATGKKIMAAAAPTLKRLSLELGGKAPALVFEDADMDRAAAEISRGLVPHCGQMCTAVTRILVTDRAWDAFMPRMSDAVRQTACGDPMDASVAMGPIFTEAAAERYLRDIAIAAQIGEMLVEGGLCDGHPLRNVVRPALYRLDDSAHRLNQEELFAPIGMVERVPDEAAAIISANGTRFGLAASVHTRDHDRARRVARALKSGTVWINSHNRLFAEAETGGFRESGIGRLHGMEGLSDFMETKHIYAEFGLADDN